MTNEPQCDCFADWTHAVTEIPEQGLSRERKVGGEALAVVAKAFGILSLSNLAARYRIDRLAGGGYRLHGRVVADLEQACVVTLDPVPDHLDEPFDVEFWPDPPSADDDGVEQTILAERDVEVLAGGQIPVGRIAYETVVAALDPYPRKEGAEFEWRDKGQQTAGNVSPFAALAKLKKTP